MNVTKKRQKESRRKRQPRGAHADLFINIQRTAESLLWGVAEALKPAGLTPTQYNVLRILRGAGEEGLACREISERMVNRDPDITRLLDRLEKQELVKRARDGKDRRVVMTYITKEGLRVLEELDQPIADLHKRQLGHLEDHHVEHLHGLLELAREKTK
ncbi:MAG: MarR family transcriptional regulator [Pyrinomonadaceae bacterium]